MSVGVAFLCPEGFVFASDRQLTNSGGFKYEEQKIFRYIEQGWSLIFSYAGDPDTAKLFFRRIFESLRESVPQEAKEFPLKEVRGGLEDIFKDKLSKELETLIGIAVKNCGAFLFRTKKTRVVHANAAEYIGLGDSSAIRYLCDFLVHSQPSIEEAKVLASYIVFVANRYVEGCSGGPDLTVLWTNGRVNEFAGGIFPNQNVRFSHCEEEIGRALRELLLSGGTKILGFIEQPKPSIAQTSGQEP